MPRLSRLDGVIGRYAAFVGRRRWWVAALAGLCALACMSGARNVQFTDDTRYFFRQDNPQLRAYEALEHIYSQSDNVLFILTPAGDTVFSRDFLTAVEDVTDRAWKVPYVRRVDSLTNFQHSYARGDEVVVGDLVEHPSELTDDQLDRVRDVALSEPMLAGRAISRSGKVTGVTATLQMPNEGANESARVAEAARSLAEKIEEAHPGVEVRLSGNAMMDVAFAEAAQSDMKSLTPLMYALLLVGLTVFLRSAGATLVTLLVIAFSAGSAVGLAGWLGIPLTPPSANAATMVMTLAVADSVHVLATYLQQRRNGDAWQPALTHTLQVNFFPVLLTSVTTAVGFLCMNFSDVVPLNDLGNITAMGVTAAFLLSVTFLPAAMAIVPMRIAMPTERRTFWLTRVADFAIERRSPLLIGGLLAFGLLSLGTLNNRLDDTFEDYFDQTIEFRRDADYMKANLTGLHTIEYSVDAGQPGGISDPQYLKTLNRFTTWLRKHPSVAHVQSMSDTFKRLNKNMHADDDRYYEIPSRRDLAAQYLLLYELSLPQGLSTNDQINVDKSSTRVTVTTKDISTREQRELAEAGEAWLKTHGSPDMASPGSSTSMMFAYISKRNLHSMTRGTVLTLIAITFMLILSFRSVKYGLVSMVPNVIPIAAAFGVWGLTVGKVNFGLSIVASASLGIVVDDTVHIMSKYLRAVRVEQMDPREAIRYTFRNVGVPIVATTVSLVAGFGILTFSHFEVNSTLGLMTVLTIGLALLVDVLVLPAILLLADGAWKSQDRVFVEASTAYAESGE